MGEAEQVECALNASISIPALDMVVLIHRDIASFDTSSEDVFKTSSKRLQDVFKTSLKHLQDVLQRHLQNVFKPYHQVNLF